jgi:hypothetical protein
MTKDVLSSRIMKFLAKNKDYTFTVQQIQKEVGSSSTTDTVAALKSLADENLIRKYHNHWEYASPSADAKLGNMRHATDNAMKGIKEENADTVKVRKLTRRMAKGVKFNYQFQVVEKK